jgi:cytosine/adenosine deaminase-related metal-dependent hydrolase
MADIEQPWTLTARWIIPVDGPPLENGTVTIKGDQFLNPQPHGVRGADINLGNCAILPGFVNAHTHLDLSGMRGKCLPTPDFTQWLRGVIAHRRSRTAIQTAEDVAAGYRESLEFGTTLLGDIDAGGFTCRVFSYSSMRLVDFHEVIGLTKERAAEAFTIAQDRLWKHASSPICRAGLSPHAPYSVRRGLYQQVLHSAWVSRNRFPIAIHLAETQEELELLQSHRGPFVQFLSELGAWDPEGLIEGVDEILKLADIVGSILLIHCNYLNPKTPVPPNASIVYCPRTHAAFGHPPHPFREFLACGVRVALGTDSLASNPDLDVLAEARFVRRHYPDVSPATILHMATLAGAEALGWADVTGSITVGKSADLVVLPLPNVDSPEPYSLILESTTRVKAVLFRGRWTVGGP